MDGRTSTVCGKIQNKSESQRPGQRGLSCKMRYSFACDFEHYKFATLSILPGFFKAYFALPLQLQMCSSKTSLNAYSLMVDLVAFD